MKKICICLAFVTLALCSCNDYLDKKLISKIDSEKFFANEEQLQLFANGLYLNMTPDAENLTTGGSTCDYLARNTTSPLLEKKFTVNQMSGWNIGAWKDLFRINYFLEHMDKAACTPEVINHYRGIARFWRALFYFDKVKSYGDVPWYNYTIQADDTTSLYKARDNREMVMDSVLQDINYACDHIMNRAETTVTPWMALAMKSRICLFEGTYRKYHTVNPSTGEAWKDATAPQRFLQESISASEKIINSGKFKLYNTGKPEADYRHIFQQEAPVRQEVIWAKEYSAELSSYHNLTQLFVSSGNQSNRWSPTQEFVNTYLNRDGSRFTDTSGYETKNFVQNSTNRDCRLAQSMMMPGYTKLNNNGEKIETMPDWSVTMTGYQVIKYNMDGTFYEVTNHSSNAVPVIRYAEILLNEAEAKAELGQMTSQVWNKTIRLLRERAGMNGRIPTTADPYLVSYYDNKVTDMWLLEIRRERAVELFFEGGGLRYDDLMRWKQGEMLTKKLGSIYIGAKNTAVDTNGDGINDLIVVDKMPASRNPNLTYVDLSKTRFYTFKDGRLYVANNNVWEDKKYTHPIPTAARVKNPNLAQNYGWE